MSSLKSKVNYSRFASFATLILVGLSLWLLVSFVVKAQDHRAFISTVESHGLIASAWAPGLSVAFIAMEGFLAVIALAFSIVSRRSASFAALMFAFFFSSLSFYAASLVVIPPANPVSCGCGVGGESVANWMVIAVQNTGIALLAFACGLILARDWPRTPREHPSGSLVNTPHVASR